MAHIPAELIEPVLEESIGVFWNQFSRDDRTLQAAKTFWTKMRALSIVALASGSAHARVAMNNNLNKAADLIESIVGVHPYDKGWK
jgi:hypothetical protein